MPRGQKAREEQALQCISHLTAPKEIHGISADCSEDSHGGRIIRAGKGLKLVKLGIHGDDFRYSVT